MPSFYFPSGIPYLSSMLRHWHWHTFSMLLKAVFLQCMKQLLAYEYLVVQSDSCIFACFDIESDLGE